MVVATVHTLGMVFGIEYSCNRKAGCKSVLVTVIIVLNHKCHSKFKFFL